MAKFFWWIQRKFVFLQIEKEKNGLEMCTVNVQVNEAALRRSNPAFSSMDAISQWVQHLVDVATQELTADKSLDDFPCLYTEEEAIAEARRRVADLRSGKDHTIPHSEVMKEMNELLASYAG